MSSAPSRKPAAIESHPVPPQLREALRAAALVSAMKADYLTNARCTTVGVYVKVYVSWRVNGETKELSRERYQRIRASTPRTATEAASELNLHEGDLRERCIDEFERGAARADRYIEDNGALIESKVRELRHNRFFDPKHEQLSGTFGEAAQEQCLRSWELPSQTP